MFDYISRRREMSFYNEKTDIWHNWDSFYGKAGIKLTANINLLWTFNLKTVWKSWHNNAFLQSNRGLLNWRI